MAAITKRLLHLRLNSHSYARPRLYIHKHFSSSSDPDTGSDIPQTGPDSAAQERPSISSGFNDIKARLQREPPQQNRHQIPRPPPQNRQPSSAESTEEIRRQLSEFRTRSAAPPPPPSAGQYVSLQELYERNVNSAGEGSAASSGFNSGGKHFLENIRASLRQLTPAASVNGNDSGGKLSDRWSRPRFMENPKNANQDSTMLGGENQSFVPSFLRRKGDSKTGPTGFRRMEFGRTFDHADLGKKLKMLRPGNRKGKWFSLQEFSGRLAKLREAEDKEMEANFGGMSVVKELRDGIMRVKKSEEEKAQKRPMHNLGILGSIGGTESYKLEPPKNHLVEKYFHPDNMSSAEKLKLELNKVRDEFKLSESDCGSARVQVAQLTTKIRHLSTVLQKKDKHSRRGLQAMVQRRKKLLKYLRRTDWDSYCLVLSKLGLRDNPDIKA